MNYIAIAIHFGFYTATLMWLAYMGGGWLDERFGAAPYFTFFMVILAIVLSFSNLFEKLKIIDKIEQRKKDKKNNNNI